MKRLVAVVALLLAVSGGLGQDPTRLFTRPPVPSRETLHNLNLKMAWRTLLPLESKRDGITSVQPLGDEILIQLRNGSLLLLNGETGQLIWQRLVGVPYRATIPPTANESSIVGINGTRLFSLERTTGSIQWEFDLPNAPSTSPVIDAEQVYVSLTGGRLLVYRMIKEAMPTPPPPPPPESELPPPGKLSGSAASRAISPLSMPGRTYFGISPLSSLTDAGMSLAVKYRIPLVYNHVADSRLEYPPLLTPRTPDHPGYVLVAESGGSVYTLSKVTKLFNYNFKGTAPISAPLAQFQDTAYICLDDSTVYAMNIENGELRWRMAAPTRVSTRPDVTAEDVYLAPENNGLMRLSRATGDVYWRNPDAVRFLAANKTFVYANDRQGQLLVLDRARGTKVATFNSRDFVFPITNVANERLFLAAQDGQLLCLYDRGSPPPQASRRAAPAAEEKAEKKGEKK